ncbi:hypothetical protein GDO86_010147 [Hymenochirus boettgeri]|uniref:Pentraxin-related protein PTX3 n=1 Tax=Hymenochirus boettgeri TaxID=247094 RepID=A0A8T2JJ12_9PIPI|nr:hypothetical protein GDO86_010147 [Hymenochirus boettgeri]
MTPLNLLVCAVCCISTALTIEDVIYVKLNNDLDNGIPENGEVYTECQTKDLTKWDKLFTMMENSQMKENMLLQSVDEVVKVELQNLRGEMLQFVTNFAGACASNIERATAKVTNLLDRSLTSKCEQAQQSEKGLLERKETDWENAVLLNLNITERLDRIEEALYRQAELQQSQTKDSSDCIESSSTLVSVLQELDQVTAKLYSTQKWISQRFLPAGCDSAILFPMRSSKIYASVHPTDRNLQALSFCIWVKVTEALDKTIVFSYGTKRNPYEIQLYLNYQSSVLVIGDNQNKVTAENAVESGNWTHICGTWDSEDGKATLWVNGENKAISYDVAKGHIIPNKGIFQLGQEKNGCCVGGGFEESLAFSGRITGFNLWDKELSEEEITWTGAENGCTIRGNVVGWGTTEIQPHGGAQYIQ